MVFGSYKTSPLFNRFNLPYSDKRNAFDSCDEGTCGTTDLITQDDSNDRCPYNFDAIHIKPRKSVIQPQILLPIPLPCIEPVPTKDLDDTCGLDLNGESFEHSPIPLYQWNRPNAFSIRRSQEKCVDGVDILKSLISFERNLFASPVTVDSNSENEEDNDETFLLYDQNSTKRSKLLKSSDSQNPYGFCSKAYKKVSRTVPDECAEDDTLYLMQEVQGFNNSFFERQLAFDIDSVDEPSLSGSSTSQPNSFEPQWVLQPDNIALETPPPSPGLQYGRKYYTDSRLYCDEDYMDTDDEAVLFSSLIQRHCHSKFPVFIDACDQSMRKNYNPLETENGVGSCANLIQMGPARKFFACDRLRRRNRGRKAKRNSLRSSRHGRKLSGRHSPVQERTFSPNLSTVTEKPSEEDASCLPTPRSCKESHPFASREFFKVSSHQSEDETTETCTSSKESDN
jgi:hypothetical protein